MCLCNLCSHRFLQAVSGTDVFAAYCRDRGLARPSDGDTRAWARTLASLPESRRAKIEVELAAVAELAKPEGLAHLLEANSGIATPPGTVPDGIPLALWYLLHRGECFWEVFAHHETREADPRYLGRASPGISVPNPNGRARLLAAGLQTFFQEYDGAAGRGPRGTTRAFRLADSLYFNTLLAGRSHLREKIDRRGKVGQECRPVTHRVTFEYHPRDGTVLLRAPVRSPERIAELLTIFGRTVLQSPVARVSTGFALDRLRAPFRPIPDAEDMESVRVKALQLQYPARLGRRRLGIETLTSDAHGAVEDLLAVTMREPPAGSRVSHAVLQVRLRVAGRAKNYLVHLWPDRCDTGPGAVGDRLLACVRRWGL